MQLLIISRGKDGKSVMAVAKRGKRSETFHLRLQADGLYYPNYPRDIIKRAYKLEDGKLTQVSRMMPIWRMNMRFARIWARFILLRRLLPIFTRRLLLLVAKQTA